MQHFKQNLKICACFNFSKNDLYQNTPYVYGHFANSTL